MLLFPSGAAAHFLLEGLEMMNGWNWQTVVSGVAYYWYEQEQVKELDRLLEADPTPEELHRLEEAAADIVRTFLGWPDDAPSEVVRDAWAALSEAYAAQKQLARMVARLEALCVVYSSNREAS